MTCFVIAEAGVNHNGSLDLAIELVDAAVAAKADAVKFQAFKADRLVTRTAEKAEYQKALSDKSESHYEMLRRLEMSPQMHMEVQKYCVEMKIEFLSSPFDGESLNFLIEELDLKILKIPSGELVNGPLLLQAAHAGRKIILSTGMGTLAEVDHALQVIAFGLTTDKTIPSPGELEIAYASKKGQAALSDTVTLLHCTTEYPAPFESVNLKSMDTLRNAFGLPVGLSDHTVGITIPIAAVAKEACVIEKHFTLDRSMPGPDHRASLEPDELKSMVEGIRSVETALGTGRKLPHSAERKNIDIVRKSIVAARKIDEGEVFTAENLDFKRPGGGVSPMLFWNLIGKKATTSYTTDDLIKIEWD